MHNTEDILFPARGLIVAFWSPDSGGPHRALAKMIGPNLDTRIQFLLNFKRRRKLWEELQENNLGVYTLCHYAIQSLPLFVEMFLSSPSDSTGFAFCIDHF